MDLSAVNAAMLFSFFFDLRLKLDDVSFNWKCHSLVFVWRQEFQKKRNADFYTVCVYRIGVDELLTCSFRAQFVLHW